MKTAMQIESPYQAGRARRLDSVTTSRVGSGDRPFPRLTSSTHDSSRRFYAFCVMQPAPTEWARALIAIARPAISLPGRRELT
jgi:hypothetical protein